MPFYQSDWSKIYKKCMNHHSAPWCEISNNWIENFLRYSEISWFYVDFNHSFGQGMLFYRPIDLIFERNRDFVIIHHPAKFHENRLRTFWDNRVTDTHTHRHTHRHIHADENNTSSKTKFLGEVKITKSFACYGCTERSKLQLFIDTKQIMIRWEMFK